MTVYANCSVNEVSLPSAPQELVSRWLDLYNNAESPSVYLSPHFILTASKTFYSGAPKIVFLEENGVLLSLTLIEKANYSGTPIPAVRRLFKTKHSFESSILVRKDLSDELLDIFVLALVKKAWVLEFTDLCLDSGPGLRLIKSVNRLGIYTYERKRYERAILSTREDTKNYQEHIRPKRLKEISRQKRRLSELGEVKWQVIHAGEITQAVVQEFLDLEHAGWKGETGGSLLSCDEERRFFVELVDKLQKDNAVFFTNLSLDRKVVAATVNFLAGTCAYAFKVAWLPDFSKYSPGILNEMFYLEYLGENTQPYAYIDSGAGESSFINAFWPGRVTMLHGHFVRGAFPIMLARCLAYFRGVKASRRRRNKRGLLV